MGDFFPNKLFQRKQIYEEKKNYNNFDGEYLNKSIIAATYFSQIWKPHMCCLRQFVEFQIISNWELSICRAGVS